MRKQCEHLSTLRMRTRTPERHSSGEENTHTQVHTHTQSSCLPDTLSLINLPLLALLPVPIFPGLHLASFRAIESALAACTSHRLIQFLAAIDVVTVLCIQVIFLLHQAHNLHHVLVFISIQDLHAHVIFADVTHQRWPRITAGAHIAMSWGHLEQILADMKH